MITDEVIDAIARIEMHRRDMEKEAGVAAACNEALRKLHELLDHERQAHPRTKGRRRMGRSGERS